MSRVVSPHREGRLAPALLLFAAMAASVPARAHDFWLAPSEYHPAGPSTVRLYLEVGEPFDGRSLPRMAAHIRRFVDVGPAGEKSVPGQEGLSPAGFLRLDEPGLHTIAYASEGTLIELSAERFAAHLEHEGLDAVAALRTGRGEDGSATSELFSRCAKALVRVGDAGGQPADRLLGLPLELVLEKPAAPAAGDEISLRVLFEGRPLPGILVSAHGTAHPDRPLTARSDADGSVRFALDGGGTWMIGGVHMVEGSPAAGADWVSYWASLTFEAMAHPVDRRPGRAPRP